MIGTALPEAYVSALRKVVADVMSAAKADERAVVWARARAWDVLVEFREADLFRKKIPRQALR